MNKRTRIILASAYAIGAIGCVCLLIFLASTIFPALRFLRPMQPFLLVAGLMWPSVGIMTVRRIRREQRRP